LPTTDCRAAPPETRSDRRADLAVVAWTDQQREVLDSAGALLGAMWPEMGAEDMGDWLDELLDEQFLGTVLGKKHLVVPGDPDRFAGLLSWADLERLLSYHELRTPRLRVVREGEYLPPASYLTTYTVRRGRTRTTVDTARLWESLSTGYTLALRQADELHPPLSALAARYERVLGRGFELNVYASMRPREGFGPHWDEHDVFVHQLAGAKRWRILPRTAHSLMPRDQPPDDAPETVLDEVTLTAGDLLYLPRGFWHAPVACPGTPSLHLTGSVPAVTGADLAAWLLDQCRPAAAMCADVPRFADPATQRAYLTLLRDQLCTGLTEPAQLDRFLAERDAAHAPRPRAGFLAGEG
jgi:hypothetical protein